MGCGSAAKTAISCGRPSSSTVKSAAAARPPPSAPRAAVTLKNTMSVVALKTCAAIGPVATATRQRDGRRRHEPAGARAGHGRAQRGERTRMLLSRPLNLQAFWRNQRVGAAVGDLPPRRQLTRQRRERAPRDSAATGRSGCFRRSGSSRRPAPSGVRVPRRSRPPPPALRQHNGPERRARLLQRLRHVAVAQRAELRSRLGDERHDDGSLGLAGAQGAARVDDRFEERRARAGSRRNALDAAADRRERRIEVDERRRSIPKRRQPHRPAAACSRPPHWRMYSAPRAVHAVPVPMA